jgi:cysteine desulfuration protein SufE
MLCVFGFGGREWGIMRIKDKITQWSETLSQLSGMDRLEYLIELGRKLEPLDEKYQLESFKIRGCASNLWFVPIFEKEVLKLQVGADAFITRGTAYIILDILNGQKYKNIQRIKIEDFASLGMTSILTPQRQNGLGSLILTIKNYANGR